MQSNTDEAKNYFLKIKDHTWFEPTIMVLILINAIVLGVDASNVVSIEHHHYITLINRILLSIFLFEIVVRVLADKVAFISDWFSLFDAFVVLLSAVAEFIVYDSLQIARLFRIFRIIRLFTVHSETRLIVESIVSSLRGLFWILLFFFFDIYFFGLVGHVLFAEIQPENFATLGLSMLTMVQVMTFDSWFTGVAREIVLINGWYLVFFITYIITTAFMLMNLIIGVIVGGVSEAQTAQETRVKVDVIEKAFIIEDKIKTRKLLAELKIDAFRRWLPLPVAMTRLQYSSDEIYKAIESTPSLRLRAVKTKDDDSYESDLMIEYSPVNTDFGVHENRASSIHVIATQCIGDTNVGHFSRTLASSLNANYYSNEFFGTGELRQEFQINFASSEDYYKPIPHKCKTPFLKWQQTLKSHIKKGDLVIYLTSANPDNDPIVHILCGGKLKDTFTDIADPTVSNPAKVAEIAAYIGNCSAKETDEKIIVTGHEFYGNINKNHVSRFIRNETQADVISLHVSMKLLQFAPLDQYYKSIRIIADSIIKNW